MQVDLHSHTTMSDGVLEPEALVALAVEKGLRYLAITDHDTTDGLPRALEKAKEYPSLTLIPGVELNTDVPQGEVHILGYFVDYEDQEFQAVLENFRESRYGRAQKMVQRLRDMGMEIEWERVKEFAGDGAIGRPHVAQALVERGYVQSVHDAFTNYIGRDGPAYVERQRLTPIQAVEHIKKAKGLPVLAHPGDIKDLDSLIIELKVVGLVGMEVYYDHYPQNQIDRLAVLAEKHHLVPCGGSDFHGEGLGALTDLGDVDVPQASVERLLAIAHSRVEGTLRP